MIAVIVAYARNRVIGRNGRIPWKIKGEQVRFRELTTGNVVVMGRRTYEEIGKPLPGRMTIVLSKTKQFSVEKCVTADSLAEAIALAGDRDIYIAGGARLYKEALPLAEKLYITEVEASVEGDTFFPDFDESQYVKEKEVRCEGVIPYTYVTYARKSTGQWKQSEV